MLISNDSFGITVFRIYKLFGRNNVHIDFTDKIKVFVGENGIGKTIILNILYYSITKNFEKLSEFDFHSIEIEFTSGEKARLSKNEITKKDYHYLEAIYNLSDIERKYDDSNLIAMEEALDKCYSKIEDEYLYMAYKIAERKRGKKLNSSQPVQPKEFIRKINKYVNLEILYFPTYRRIEEDLGKLGFDLDAYKKDSVTSQNKEVIKFGMDDVEQVFKNLEKEITDSALKGYSLVTGEMITHLVHGKAVTGEMKRKVKEASTLDIVLDRVGEDLKEFDKDKIRLLISENKLFNNTERTHEPLIFFLSKLIDIYELHREKEESIKKFAEVCNEYLVNKIVKYDERDVKISIIEKKTGEYIKLKDLSSGEKQIVSLFCKVYLNSSKEFIVLFDEPELSLSIEWQERLLPDIINSGRCKFLVAVTHSPFIYSQLEEYAESIELAIEEVELYEQ
ncbi:TPA: AAA family ATPase [Bacillus cereus]|nr:AAA family ATPase [Bacillus cereus]